MTAVSRRVPISHRVMFSMPADSIDLLFFERLHFPLTTKLCLNLEVACRARYDLRADVMARHR